MLPAPLHFDGGVILQSTTTLLTTAEFSHGDGCGNSGIQGFAAPDVCRKWRDEKTAIDM